MSELSKEEIIYAFNAWMKTYAENEKNGFMSVDDSIAKFIAEELAGETPTYGNTCYATLQYYVKQMKEETYVTTI